MRRIGMFLTQKINPFRNGIDLSRVWAMSQLQSARLEPA